MRKVIYGVATAALLLGSPALAADLRAPMPVKAPAYVAAYNWTGFYLGVNVGYGWAHADDALSVVSPAGVAVFTGAGTTNLNGVIGGGQIGYNWQTGNLLFGVEADIQGSGETAVSNMGCGVIGACSLSVSDHIRWFGTARGRVGYAADRWLFYITGGGAWQGLSSDVGATVTGVGTSGLLGTSSTRFGWVLGGGVETALWGNWTGGVEYLYIDTGNFSNNGIVGAGTILAAAGAPVGSTFSETDRVKNNIIRAKLNYRF